MRITYIALRHTRLDASYENVYDGYQTAEEYDNFLKSVSGGRVINIDKSVKLIENEFDIVVEIDINDALRYNYCRIKSPHGNYTSDYFAFILSHESLNDSSNPSVKLHCKMDAWANNVIRFQGREMMIKEKQCTYDTHTNYNYPKVFDNFSNDSRVTPLKFLQTDSNFVVLWCRVDTNITPLQATAHIKKNGNFIDSAVVNSINGGLASFYYPAAIFEIVDGGTIEYIKSWHGTMNYRNYGLTPYEDVSEELFGSTLGSALSSEFIIKNNLTFNFPCFYTVVENGTHLGMRHFDITFSNNSQIRGSTYITKGGQEILRYISNGILDVTPDFSKDYTITNLKQLYSANRRYEIGEAREQIENEYPLSYYSIIIGDTTIPLTGNYQCADIAYIKMRYLATQPYLHIYNNRSDKMVYTSPYTEKELYIANEKLEQYLLRNQVTFNTTALGSIARLLSFGLGSTDKIVGPTENIATHFSTIADLKNQANSARITGELASINPFVLDCPILAFNSNNLKAEYIDDFHYYGMKSNFHFDISSKRRDLFDYDKGDIVSNTCITNELQFIEIKEAVKRGITRWHIRDKNNIYDDSETNHARRNILLNFNKNSMNYPNSLIPNP